MRRDSFRTLLNCHRLPKTSSAASRLCPTPETPPSSFNHALGLSHIPSSAPIAHGTDFFSPLWATAPRSGTYLSDELMNEPKKGEPL